MSSFQDLEATAQAVIEHLKRVKELADSKVLIIGGLAICKHLPAYRNTRVTSEQCQIIFHCKLTSLLGDRTLISS